MKYDYLIVGAGLFGSTFSRMASNDGKKCLVIDKRTHIGGNCYDEHIDNILVHKYGPHIFHTSNEMVWKFIKKYSDFNEFRYKVIVNNNNKLYSFPINLLTMYQMWGCKTPEEAKSCIKNKVLNIKSINNLEEYCISKIGKELYELFIRGYTKKQWRKDPKELPEDIIKRLPIRFTFDDNYYIDKYQGIPSKGYNFLFNRLLNKTEVLLNTDYFSDKKYFDSLAPTIIFSGRIDEYYGFKLGELEYLTIKFDIVKKSIEDYQGVPAINFTNENIPYTRVVEHKHFYPNLSNSKTVISFEYPVEWTRTSIPYYPINTGYNNKIYEKYSLLNKNKKIIFGGRLGSYRYMDMDKVILSAIDLYKSI